MRHEYFEHLDGPQSRQDATGRCILAKGSNGQQSQPSNTTSVQTKEIPTWAQPSAQSLLARGEALSNQPYQTYAGNRIADMTQEQASGMNAISKRALYGSPEEQAARTNYTDTMSGKYLTPDSNPYLRNTVNQAMNDVQGRVNSQFSGNNYGTTAHQETLARTLGQVANDAYGQNYAMERGNQLKSSVLMPQYSNIDYNNAQQLIGVGDIKRQEAQDVLNNKYADWAAAQNQPYRQLDVLANALGAAVNGQGSVQSAGYQSSPYTVNRYANAIGGALAGGSLGSGLSDTFGSNSGAYGAGIGGLLGYMSS